jgi:flagellar P-ring protein FlgI
MLQQLGITLPAGTNPMLQQRGGGDGHRRLPPFAQPGQPVDVTVSSMGNAKSLKGGTLLMTPLKGADGLTYAVAQGNILVGGAGASAGGSKVQINHLAAGRVPDGAIVERAIPNPFPAGRPAAARTQRQRFCDRGSGRRRDQRHDGRRHGLGARWPRDRSQGADPPNARVRFVADLENIDITTEEPAARVVINARTGSIAMNRTVTLEPAAVAHGNLSVTITSTPMVSQPGPLSGGQTTVTQKTDISIKQDGGTLMKMPAATNLADLVKALNSLGANPGDLVSILQALKASGALRAEVEVI